MSADREGNFEDDETHPIARVGVIDIVMRFESGSAYYGLVIKGPLRDDLRSQQRLLRKIKNYLGDFLSTESKMRMGEPTPEKAKTFVSIHPSSDASIFAFLERCRPWVEEENHVELILRINDADTETGIRELMTASHAQSSSVH